MDSVYRNRAETSDLVIKLMQSIEGLLLIIEYAIIREKDKL